MQRREEGGAVRVHRPGHEGHQVQVADVGDVVSGGQRATDVQVGDPATRGQLRASSPTTGGSPSSELTVDLPPGAGPASPSACHGAVIGAEPSDRPPTVARVTLSFAGALDRDVVVHATDLVAGLVARPEVSADWTVESSCAGHERRGSGSAPGQPAGERGPAAHDRRARWRRDHRCARALRARGVDHGRTSTGTPTASIRATSDEQAAEGPDAAQQLVSGAREQLATALTGAPPIGLHPVAGVGAGHRRLPRHAADGDGRARGRPRGQRRGCRAGVRTRRPRPRSSACSQPSRYAGTARTPWSAPSPGRSAPPATVAAF